MPLSPVYGFAGFNAAALRAAISYSRCGAGSNAIVLLWFTMRSNFVTGAHACTHVRVTVSSFTSKLPESFAQRTQPPV